LDKLRVLNLTCSRDEKERKNKTKETHSGFYAVYNSPTGESSNNAAEKRSYTSLVEVQTKIASYSPILFAETQLPRKKPTAVPRTVFRMLAATFIYRLNYLLDQRYQQG